MGLARSKLAQESQELRSFWFAWTSASMTSLPCVVMLRQGISRSRAFVPVRLLALASLDGLQPLCLCLLVSSGLVTSASIGSSGGSPALVRVCLATCKQGAAVPHCCRCEAMHFCHPDHGSSVGLICSRLSFFVCFLCPPPVGRQWVYVLHFASRGCCLPQYLGHV